MISDPNRLYDVWLAEIVDVIGPTGVFGDAELIRTKQVRSQTAICIEDGTELLSIGREQYSRCIEKVIRKDIEQKVQFLREIRIFQNMTNTQLEQLLKYVKPMKMDFGHTVFKHNDLSTGIYVVQSGSFELTVQSTLSQTAEQIAADHTKDLTA